MAWASFAPDVPTAVGAPLSICLSTSRKFFPAATRASPPASRAGTAFDPARISRATWRLRSGNWRAGFASVSPAGSDVSGAKPSATGERWSSARPLAVNVSLREPAVLRDPRCSPVGFPVTLAAPASDRTCARVGVEATDFASGAGPLDLPVSARVCSRSTALSTASRFAATTSPPNSAKNRLRTAAPFRDAPGNGSPPSLGRASASGSRAPTENAPPPASTGEATRTGSIRRGPISAAPPTSGDGARTAAPPALRAETSGTFRPSPTDWTDSGSSAACPSSLRTSGMATATPDRSGTADFVDPFDGVDSAPRVWASSDRPSAPCPTATAPHSGIEEGPTAVGGFENTVSLAAAPSGALSGASGRGLKRSAFSSAGRTCCNTATAGVEAGPARRFVFPSGADTPSSAGSSPSAGISAPSGEIPDGPPDNSGTSATGQAGWSHTGATGTSRPSPFPAFGDSAGADLVCVEPPGPFPRPPWVFESSNDSNERSPSSGVVVARSAIGSPVTTGAEGAEKKTCMVHLGCSGWSRPRGLVTGNNARPSGPRGRLRGLHQTQLFGEERRALGLAVRLALVLRHFFEDRADDIGLHQ